MRRRTPVKLDVKHERWLVSYSDFVTLLFAFFVVMYSISQVNEGKYRVLSNTLLEAFSVPKSAINPIQVGDPTKGVAPSAFALPEQSQAKKEQQHSTSDSDLQQLEESVSEQFADLIGDQLLQVNSNELWLQLELSSNILFPTASADPSLQAKGIFEEVAGMLSGYNNVIQVEGFTDNVPINNRRYKSNWELSAARAASVVKLLASNGVNPENLAAVGRGEFQPVADNSTAAGRARNRRVVVMISKQSEPRPQIDGNDVGDVMDGNDSSANNDTTLDEPIVETEETAKTDVATSQSTVEADSSVEPVAEQPVIEPIELNNGGLLFTSDPDLPRNNSPRSDAPPEALDNQ